MCRRWARGSIQYSAVNAGKTESSVEMYPFVLFLQSKTIKAKYLYLLNIYERFIPVSGVRLGTDGRLNELLSVSADDQIGVNQ